jgi:hypothetical protein
MFSRYRSYTSYSEENGKLVPSIEPMENTTLLKIADVEIYKTGGEKKLKSDQSKQIVVTNKVSQ